MALGLIICLSNLVWQVKHGFISLHFLQHIHARDVRQGRADGFLGQQFWICTNLFAAPFMDRRATGLICEIDDVGCWLGCI